MTDGLGNAVGGLLGLAIVAKVAGDVIHGPPRTRTVYKTVYRTRPVTLKKKKRKANPNYFGL